MVYNFVDSIGTTEKPTSMSRSLENPRSDKTISQTNVVDEPTITGVNELPFEKLVTDHVSVMSKTVDVPIFESTRKP